jgi:hypothetical protein
LFFHSLFPSLPTSSHSPPHHLLFLLFIPSSSSLFFSSVSSLAQLWAEGLKGCINRDQSQFFCKTNLLLNLEKLYRIQITTNYSLLLKHISVVFLVHVCISSRQFMLHVNKELNEYFIISRSPKLYPFRDEHTIE